MLATIDVGMTFTKRIENGGQLTNNVVEILGHCRRPHHHGNNLAEPPARKADEIRFADGQGEQDGVHGDVAE